MKKLTILGVAVAALLASPAMAADLPMPVKAPPMVAPPPPMTWTGCYIGGNLGWAKQDTHVELQGYNEPFGPFTPYYYDYGWTNGAGGVFGGQVGCDYQLNSNWVVGVRGMFDGTNINQDLVYDPVSSSDDLNMKTEWFATALGRIGYLALPNALVYVKGGAAWKHVSYNYCAGCAEGPEYIATATQTVLGYDVGVGFEYAFIPNLSAFAELDYLSFPGTNTSLTFSSYPGAPGDVIKFSHDMLMMVVGMNWRFH